ncbi:MAG: sugar phosphate isomerase/epimerase [Tannerella sp.]|jgi:sugar phosphate isomerase/epimerase|nr:sugar phosphate isomerase/epimerase [Tannerella sp.]
MTSRRNFVKKAGAGLLAAGASSVFGSKDLHADNPGEYAGSNSSLAKKEELFKIGMAGFTFRSFDIDQTLQMLDRLDVRYLCIKDFHLPFNSTDANIKAFHAKLAAKNIIGYGVGPVYMNSEKEVDDAFDYARRVGVKIMVGIPPQGLFAYVSQKVKQYDIRYAIHNHGPEDKFPDATSIYERVKDLDPRMGLCLDVGHNMRAGKNPATDLKRYSARIFDIHIKNVTEATEKGGTCEMGRGVIDIPELVKTLRSVKYSGVCSLEFEKDGNDPLAGVAESIGYLRGVIDAL